MMMAGLQWRPKIQVHVEIEGILHLGPQLNISQNRLSSYRQPMQMHVHAHT